MGQAKVQQAMVDVGAVRGERRSAVHQSTHDDPERVDDRYAKVAVALLVLGVPIIDTFWIIVRRLMDRRSPFTPDRSHIHHRLLDLGLSHRYTVLAIYGICAILGLVAMLLSEVSQLYAFLGVFVVSGLVLFGPTRGAFRRPEELEAEAYESARTDV